MDSCKYELYNKELRFEEPNRCLSLVRKKPSNFLDGSSSKWRDVIKNCGLKNPTAVRVW